MPIYHLSPCKSSLTAIVTTVIHSIPLPPISLNHFSSLFQVYAREQEKKHIRKIVLPCVIPWEAGSNKFASQKGSKGFGAPRNTSEKRTDTHSLNCPFSALQVSSSRKLSESSDGVVPWISCPPMKEKYATQAGTTPFGGVREHVCRVLQHVSRKGDEQRDG